MADTKQIDHGAQETAAEKMDRIERTLVDMKQSLERTVRAGRRGARRQHDAGRSMVAFTMPTR